MPVVFGPFLRQVAERAPIPVPVPRRPDDADDSTDGTTNSATAANTGDSSGVRRFALPVIAGAAALVVGRWLAHRSGGGDESTGD